MGKLMLGVARRIITPKVGCQLYGYSPDVFSERVEDDLTVSAFYFEQGDLCALMISAAVCLINSSLSDEILSLIEEKYAIPKENCMLCATHTHSGPNTAGESGWGDIDRNYCDGIFVPRILEAVGEAVKNRVPVKMGIAVGKSLVGINRREINENNKVILGQNPWGSFDPQMTVISFRDEGGKNVANMIHYGAHGTAAGKNHKISRDWSGIMTDTLEKQTGAITAFFNGPEGDVGPRISNGKTTGDISYVKELGNVAAMDAVNIYNTMLAYHDAELRVSHKNLRIPLKKRVSLEEAVLTAEQYKGQTVNIKGMIRAQMERVIGSYEQGYVDADAREVGQTLISLGDAVFASFPYELFSEVGMRINKAVKNKTVLSLSNTNGSEGYFVTQDSLCRGGYEVNMFLYGHVQSFFDDADFYLMRETVDHINGLK